ncbi:MAG: NAD(P)/FAD-dependent oxidoreductase [Chloroflexaceae bacterium]|nr:NAD(P)/FAD-dependent oxidoreductase [Chloroflexaceae bacterium]
MTTEHVDVLIVGAGLSGICAAYYVQKECPGKRYAILEGRESLGGTWDLFRYPGVRSDSEMYTLGYSFRPWRGTNAIADGPTILQYLRETAAAYGIDRHIRFQHRVQHASWSSADGMWTVEATRGSDGSVARFTCQFLMMCSGYYSYASGYTPSWPGLEQFNGTLVHPQQWPETLDYSGKRVVVIGSGATAVTLIPAMADKAAHITMVQRSPSYVAALPSHDLLAARLQRLLPADLAYRLTRWKAILLSMYTYQLAQRMPRFTRKTLLKLVQDQLGPEYDVEKHFGPRYNPWDQRLCLAPDGDLFAAIKAGKASVVTDQIETFTSTGIKLQSGQELAADIIVTATGLNAVLMPGVQLVVDGAPVELAQTLSYKGVMFSDVPNMASIFGYVNASWTLKAELISKYVCRLLNYMNRHGYSQATPRRPRGAVGELPAVPLNSGYIQRSLSIFPRQGTREPWRVYQNYLQDVLSLALRPINDGTMVFARRAVQLTRHQPKGETRPA